MAVVTDAENTVEQFAVVSRFPPPAGSIQRVLEKLEIVRHGDPPEMATAGDLNNLPRPWDPATCPAGLRQDIWHWCDQVAAWINHDYAWRPVQMIPACWPHHPHIARELPVLAILRWNAERTLTPDATEEWNRYALPTFLDRMTKRLGESGCLTGRHLDWPAASRHAAFVDDDSRSERAETFYADTRTVVRLQLHRR